jgi:hypothetical protein
VGWVGKHYCPNPIIKLIEVVLTAVGPLLIIGENVVVSLRLEPVADAERALDAADEVGVLVGVFAGLVEHPDDLLAAQGRLKNMEAKRKISTPLRGWDRFGMPFPRQKAGRWIGKRNPCSDNGRTRRRVARE